MRMRCRRTSARRIRGAPASTGRARPRASPRANARGPRPRLTTFPPQTVAREERSRRYASTVRGERCAARWSRKRSTSRSGAERTRRAIGFAGRAPAPLRATLGRLPLRVAVPAAGAVAALLVAAFPAPAQASQLIARDTSTERLAVARDGKALITYRVRGKLQRVLACGCRERDLPQGGTPASQLRDRLLRWLGQVRAAGLEGLPQHVRAVPRAVAPVARDRVHRAGRLALGAAALAQVAGELRPAAVEARPWHAGAPTLALERSCRSPRSVARLELRRALAPPVRPSLVSGAPGARLLDDAQWGAARQLRPPWSTSTRTTRHTGGGGGVRTPSSRAARTGASVTGSCRIAPRRESSGRQGTGAGIASR